MSTDGNDSESSDDAAEEGARAEAPAALDDLEGERRSAAFREERLDRRRVSAEAPEDAAPSAASGVTDHDDATPPLPDATPPAPAAPAEALVCSAVPEPDAVTGAVARAMHDQASAAAGAPLGTVSSAPTDALFRLPEVEARWLHGLLSVLGVVALVSLLYLLRGVLVPVAIAMVTAYLLDPLVDRIELARIPRALAIGLLLSAVFLGAGLIVLVSVPLLLAELRAFWAELPGKVTGLVQLLDTAIREAGFDHVPTSVEDLLGQLEGTGADLKSWSQLAAKPLSQMALQLLGGTASVIQAMVGLLLIPVLAFYLLYDFDRMVAGARALVPARHRALVVSVSREVDQVLGQFVRGQLIVMLILALLYGIGYTLVGVRMALFIGLIAGLVSFVPYVGSAVALMLALAMVALDSQSLAQAGWVVAVYAAVQLLEGFYVTPKVVGENVGLPAIWVLLALMVGGDLFGFLGVLLALPVAAVLKVFVARALVRYRTSRFFLSGAP